MNPIHFYGKNILVNALAAIAPKVYTRLKGGSERKKKQSVEETLGYYRREWKRVLDLLEITDEQWSERVEEKVMVEYGPGDYAYFPLMWLGRGAARTYVCDAFSYLRFDETTTAGYEKILGEMNKEQSLRARKAIDPQKKPFYHNPELLKYVVSPCGIDLPDQSVDVTFSWAVLEHCKNAEQTIANIARITRKGGLAIHIVDFNCHGLSIGNPLHFLTHSDTFWNIMTGYKQTLNRLRWKDILHLFETHGFTISQKKIDDHFTPEDIKSIRPKLHPRFRHYTDDELAIKHVLFVAQKQ